MAEPLKAVYDHLFIEKFAALVKTAYPPFDETAFAEHVRQGDWEQLELKARCRRITEALGASLPQSYPEALEVLVQIEDHCKGLPYLFFPDFVEVYGLDSVNWEHSMAALERFTQFSSSEFAVRPFIIKEPTRMMEQMLKWAKHPNEHVRRLASEGCRPRLPWAQALPLFKQDPSPIIPILDILKQDSSLYVRKSVANNLNDIAKDHPDLVIQLAETWIGSNELTNWIVRHGCRTLIKRADARIMTLFGYSSYEENDEGDQPLITAASLTLSADSVQLGEAVALRYHVQLREGERAKLRIEYGIEFVKSGGKTSLKKFLLSDRDFPGGSTAGALRKHSFADLSTRKHYSGVHRITLWVNGREQAAVNLRITEAKPT